MAEILRSVIVFVSMLLALTASAQDAWKPPAADRLEERVDGLAVKIDPLADRLAAFEKRIGYLESLPQPVFDARWAGVVLDDPTVDNGPALNRLFANCGTKPGNVRETIVLPGGAIYFSTPIVLPWRSSLSLLCNGATIRYTESAYSGGTQYGGPASRLVYVGPAGKAAFTYPGVGLDIKGTLVIQRGELPREPARAKADGTIGFLMDCLKTPPTGKLRADGLQLIGFDVGFKAIAREGGSHGDNNQILNLRIDGCNQGLQVAENQAVGWQIGYCQASGFVENVFDFLDGGDFQCQFLKLTTQAGTRVLRVRSNTNSCAFTFGQIKIDAPDWRLVQLVGGNYLDFKVLAGRIGKSREPLPDAIDVAPGPGRFVEVSMSRNDRRWPEDK